MDKKYDNKFVEWLTPDDVATIYKFTKKNQERLRSQRKLPFVKFGRYVRYDRGELDRVLKQHKVK